jgi:eukaryotic-like serine/threonine-protein kinase
VLAGRFRLVRFLGQGGMGAVYEAEDLELGERVALKALRPDIAGMPGAGERFTREIQLARKVTHPNVCRIFDISHHRPHEGGHGGEVTFLTMELLAGETLEERLRRCGRMRPEEALPLVRQMAEGLASAHRVGVVHRDFKPANVMLVPAPDGERAVVTDFGLARAASGGGNLTLHGGLLGTPSYMAPEQVEGGEIAPATDVYALGIVLFEMVTGALPFVGDSLLSTAVKRLREPPPPPRSRVPDLAPAWNDAILRCLRSAPAERFARATDLTAALGGAAIAPARPRRQRAAVAAAVVLAGALGVGGWGWRQARRQHAVAVSSTLPVELAAGQRGPLPAGAEARRLYGEGIDLLQRLDAQAARDRFRRVIELEGAFPLAHSALAEVWQRLGYDRRAEEEAKRARDLSSRLSAAERQLVETRYLQVAHRWEPAIAGYRRLWGAHPGEIEYGLGLAEVERAAGRAGDALATVATMRRRLPAAAAADPRLDLAEAAAAGAISDYKRQQQAAERAVRKGEELGADLVQARALRLAGMARYWQGDVKGALAAFEQAKKLYAGAGDPRGQAQALNDVGKVHFDRGELEQARPLFAEARSTYAEVGDLRGEASQLNALASIAASQGRLAEAQRDFERALASFVQIGDVAEQARVLGNLAEVLGLLGDRPGAAERHQRSLALYRQLGDREGETLQLIGLAEMSLDELELAPAEAKLRDALRRAREIGNRSYEAAALAGLGTLAALRGDLEAAGEQQSMALTARRELGEEGEIAVSRLALAVLALEKGRPVQAKSSAEQARDGFRAERKTDGEGEAESVLARALLAAGDTTAARQAAARATRLVARSEVRAVRLTVALAEARVRAESDRAAALRLAAAAAAEAGRSGATGLAFEARLTLGELELAHGDARRGRDLLRQVARGARAHGCGLLAGEADRLLAGAPAPGT